MMPQRQGSLVTTPMAILEDQHQLAVEEGIPLFELHKNKRGFVDNQDLGYLNVRVSDGYDGISRHAIRSVRWFSGKNAYLKYENKGKGLLVAFCPDDTDERHQFHHWHNRIMLAGTIHSGQFRIVRYHTINGVLPEGRITEEILYLSKLIHDWKAKVKETGEIFRSKDRDKVFDFVRKAREKEQTVTEPLFSKIEKIEKIIEIHRGTWIYSPEFQNDVLPGIKEAIEKKFQPKPITPDLGSQIREYFSTMTLEQKRQFIEGMGGSVPSEPEASSPDGKPLNELTDIELKRIAGGMKITTTEKTRDELIRAIDDASGQKGNDIESVVGPETEEEKSIREEALRKDAQSQKGTFRETVEI